MQEADKEGNKGAQQQPQQALQVVVTAVLQYIVIPFPVHLQITTGLSDILTRIALLIGPGLAPLELRIGTREEAAGCRDSAAICASLAVNP